MIAYNTRYSNRVMEDNNTEGVVLNEEKTDSKTERVRRWIFSDFSRKGVGYALAFSLVIFGLYMAGSIPDPGFPDRVLFFLLGVLRYSSLVNCAFSLFAMGVGVRRLVYQPSFRNVLKLLLYFGTAILGANLALFGSLVVAVTEGNV